MLDKYMKCNMNFTLHNDERETHIIFFEKIVSSNFSTKNK